MKTTALMPAVGLALVAACLPAGQPALDPPPRAAAPEQATGGPAWMPNRKAPAAVADLPLFVQAKKAAPRRYEFAVQQKATFHPTPDGKSFYILWRPEKTDPNVPVPMIVTLHGHGSWAFDEFFLWHKPAAERGYGILALQWWFGQGEKLSDYYQPHEIYRILDGALRNLETPRQSVLLHGYSRGSANIYGVTAFDRSTGNHFAALTVANAGGAARDFPVNVQIEKGDFGARPFEGSHWVLYAGARDSNPERDGIPAMRAAREWVTRLGGTVDLLIEDAKGDHGGFHRNPENVKAALDIFAKRLAAAKAEQAAHSQPSAPTPR